MRGLRSLVRSFTWTGQICCIVVLFYYYYSLFRYWRFICDGSKDHLRNSPHIVEKCIKHVHFVWHGEKTRGWFVLCGTLERPAFCTLEETQELLNTRKADSVRCQYTDLSLSLVIVVWLPHNWHTKSTLWIRRLTQHRAPVMFLICPSASKVQVKFCLCSRV